MSMITEQIEWLKELSMADMTFYTDDDYKKACKEATNTIEQLAAKVRKENGFIFPEGATNGDMIMAMFPTVDTYFSNVIEMKLWWNAKYKGR